MINHNNKLFKKYINNNQINKASLRIAKDINSKYKNISFIGVLNGCFPFMNNLLSNIQIPYEYNFIKISSYSGMKQQKLNLEYSISKKQIIDKNIIIIEDIIDSGNSINFLLNHLNQMNPESIKVVSMLVKEKSIQFCDWYGFLLKNNKYVIGYGLDIDNLFRDLKDIYIENN